MCRDSGFGVSCGAGGGEKFGNIKKNLDKLFVGCSPGQGWNVGV
jgi:hypothetical protein